MRLTSTQSLFISLSLIGPVDQDGRSSWPRWLAFVSYRINYPYQYSISLSFTGPVDQDVQDGCLLFLIESITLNYSILSHWHWVNFLSLTLVYFHPLAGPVDQDVHYGCLLFLIESITLSNFILSHWQVQLAKWCRIVPAVSYWVNYP